MRRSLSILLTVLLAPLAALGANEHFDTLRVGEDTFKDVTVTGVTATDIYFTHAGGMGNAKLKSLSPEVRSQFNFDPEEASAVEKSRDEGAALFAARMQEERAQDLKRAEAARRRAAQEELRTQQLARQQAMSKAQPGQLLNRHSPPLFVEKWLTPKPDPTGKFVLIDFWATWCGPCRQSIPHLNALQKRFSNRLLVIGVSSESPVEVQKLTDPRIQYFSAIDTQGRTAKLVGVTSIPHAVLIDPSGIVRYQGHPSLLKDELVETLLTRFGS